MIKVDELGEFRPQVRYQNGQGVTLETVQAAINGCAMALGIPAAFKYEQVKSGGIFNSTVEDCIVMYNPEHENDYFKFCIRVKRQGTYAFVSIYGMGRSKLKGKQAGIDAFAGTGNINNIGDKIWNSAVKKVFSPNKSKMEEEDMYYSCVSDIFDQIVS